MFRLVIESFLVRQHLVFRCVALHPPLGVFGFTVNKVFLVHSALWFLGVSHFTRPVDVLGSQKNQKKLIRIELAHCSSQQYQMYWILLKSA
jgi:hypothetical protein